MTKGSYQHTWRYEHVGINPGISSKKIHATRTAYVSAKSENEEKKLFVFR